VSEVFQRRQAAATAFGLVTSIFSFKQYHASVRYIAPVSTWTNPSAFATNFELVLLPLALVPSIAMTMGRLVLVSDTV
jgi:hypothetical protein